MAGSAEKALERRYQMACALTRQVGREAQRYWHEHGPQGLDTETKGLQDFVTSADRAAEHTIRSELARNFPGDGFVGEETGGVPGSTGYWVVDPIDGTANYLRGLRHWGVSVAYVADGQTQLGIVRDAPTDRLYHARLGHGACCEGQQRQGNANPNTVQSASGAWLACVPDAGGSAPTGKRNGNYRNGAMARDALNLTRQVKELARKCKQFQREL